MPGPALSGADPASRATLPVARARRHQGLAHGGQGLSRRRVRRGVPCVTSSAVSNCPSGRQLVSTTRPSMIRIGSHCSQPSAGTPRSAGNGPVRKHGRQGAIVPSLGDSIFFSNTRMARAVPTARVEQEALGLDRAPRGLRLTSRQGEVARRTATYSRFDVLARPSSTSRTPARRRCRSAGCRSRGAGTGPW